MNTIQHQLDENEVHSPAQEPNIAHNQADVTVATQVEALLKREDEAQFISGNQADSTTATEK